MAGYGHPSVGRMILAQDDVYLRHSAVFGRYERLLNVSLTSSQKTPGEQIFASIHVQLNKTSMAIKFAISVFPIGRISRIKCNSFPFGKFLWIL